MIPDRSNGTRTSAQTVLVIGVHREELPFGDRVAAAIDAGRIDVLRIPRGLPARRPSQEEAFYYRTNHQELYLQMLPQLRGRYRLVIDLHCGINEPEPCADLFSADATLLDCACTASQRSLSADNDLIRAVLLGDGEPEGPKGDICHLRAHTIIPEPVWNNPEFRYLGLEVFMPQIGADDANALALAQDLIDSLIDCATEQGII